MADDPNMGVYRAAEAVAQAIARGSVILDIRQWASQAIGKLGAPAILSVRPLARILVGELQQNNPGDADDVAMLLGAAFASIGAPVHVILARRNETFEATVYLAVYDRLAGWVRINGTLALDLAIDAPTPDGFHETWIPVWDGDLLLAVAREVLDGGTP